MPVKKTKVAKEVQPTEAPVQAETKSINSGGDMKDKIIPILVVLIIVAAFAVGLLYGKVSVYEKGGAALKAGAALQQDDQAQAPQAVPTEGPLTEDQWNKAVAKAEFVKGDKKAKVTVVEFTDFQCPYCSRFFTDTYGKIMKDYVDSGKVLYISRDLPLPFHPNAKPAALAARCAGDQEKYWEMHDKLFTSQTEWSELSDAKDKFIGYAKDLGLNQSKFTDCYTSGKYNEAIEADAALAAEVGVSGTPSFVINGEKLVGAQPYSEFQKVIDEQLNK